MIAVFAIIGSLGPTSSRHSIRILNAWRLDRLQLQNSYERDQQREEDRHQ